MLSFVGIFIVLGMVFGGYLLAGGMIEIIIKALPFEMMMIGGAAVGALVLANSLDVVKKVAGSFGKIMKGPRWKRDDYRDLLCLGSRLKQIVEEEHRFLSVIRDTVTAHQHGHAPQVSIEIVRGNVPSKMQPSFHELD